MSGSRSTIALSNHSKGKEYEAYTKEDYESEIEKINEEIQYFKVENHIFEEYLKKHDPDSLTGVERIVEKMAKQFHKFGSSSSPAISVPSTASELTEYLRDTKHSNSSPKTVVSKLTLMGLEGEIEINDFFLLGFVDRELDERRLSLEGLTNQYESSKFSLEAEKECAKSNFLEICETRKQIEQFIVNNTDKTTGIIYADKLLRYIEKSLEKKDQEMRKLRLKTTTLRREYRRIKSQQQHKIELMERLHPIDIEKLKIENRELEQILEEKTRVLYDNKNMAGHILQNLITTKTNLNNQSVILKGLTQETWKKEQKLKKLEDENVLVRSTLLSAQKENSAIKTLIQTYRAPEVLDYVKIKVEATELNNAVKVWGRRCKNQESTLTLLTHRLRQLAGEEARSLRSRLTTTTLLNKHGGTIGSSTDDNFSICAVAS